MRPIWPALAMVLVACAAAQTPVDVPLGALRSPRDTANLVLDALAEGYLAQAQAYFNVANFMDNKQSDFVRQVYIEVQLKRLLALADDHQCAEADRGLTTLGFEDKSLPFTFNGFGGFTKGARFQFQLALVEAMCVDEKPARRRMEHVAGMHPGPASPDFAYSYMALAKLGRPEALGTAIAQLEKAASGVRAEDRGAAQYNRGMILWTLDRKSEAAAAFREGAQSAPPGMLRYLNRDALRVMTQKE